ncbi:MAG: U32 family peptidase, partial [Mycoplasmataceae bacterium]|nr:U32 family peptidase [Mycoplasmataceae bacterium]
EELVSNKKNTKIIVLVNKIFFDFDLIELEKYLVELTKLNIDGIVYADYAVNQILFEHNISIHQIYNPETLVVNYGQIPFYLDNGISEICLAREINGNNIKDIIENKKTMKIQVQVSGYSYMMWSRWNLLSNFKESQGIKDTLINRKLFLTEPKRQNKFIIIEDKDGTHTLTNYNLCLLDKLQELYDEGCDTIRIDSFLHDEEWVKENAKIYLEAISLAKNNNLTPEFIASSKERMLKYDEILSKGFYSMDKSDLIYLVQDESNK